jgi:hypothetical protein
VRQTWQPLPRSLTKSNQHDAQYIAGKIQLTGFEFPATSFEVHVGNVDKLAALANLPDEVEEQEDGQADVSGDEVIPIPFARQEDLETVENNNDRDEEDTEVSRVRLKGRLVWQSVTIDAVEFEPSIESCVGNENNVPGNETCDRGDVHQPIKDSSSTIGNVQVRKGSCQS